MTLIRGDHELVWGKLELNQSKLIGPGRVLGKKTFIIWANPTRSHSGRVIEPTDWAANRKINKEMKKKPLPTLGLSVANTHTTRFRLQSVRLYAALLFQISIFLFLMLSSPQTHPRASNTQQRSTIIQTHTCTLIGSQRLGLPLVGETSDVTGWRQVLPSTVIDWGTPPVGSICKWLRAFWSWLEVGTMLHPTRQNFFLLFIWVGSSCSGYIFANLTPSPNSSSYPSHKRNRPYDPNQLGFSNFFQVGLVSSWVNPDPWPPLFDSMKPS